MSTTKDFIEFVCEQINGVGFITYKMMFGEYMVYVNEKPLLLVCDNTVYVKVNDAIETLLCDADKGCPYKGAKEHYILDIEDTELAKKVVSILEPLTPLPKKKVKK